MTREEATVIAALVAALVALISAVFAYASSKALDLRGAHRELLAKKLDEIGSLLYELIALSKKMTDAKTDERFAEVRAEADVKAQKVDEIRRSSRYSLWGLDDGFRTLQWMPVYIAHNKERRKGERAKRLIKLGTSLRIAVDRAIITSYYKGQAPAAWRRLLVIYRAWRLRRYFNDRSDISGDVSQ